MAWTTIAKKAVGVGTPKTWLDAFIDNLTYLYNAIGGSGSSSVGELLNGSFENDTDADDVPDEWEETAGSGCANTFDTTTPAHGKKAWKFTTPGSVDNYLTTKNYILCSDDIRFVMSFLLKVSTASAAAKVQILFWDKDDSALATATLYDEATSNPTSWTRSICGTMPPTGAVRCKIRLYGGTTADSTAGDIYFDGVEILETASGIVVGYASGTGNGWSADRVYIGGVLASLTGLTMNPSYLTHIGARSGIVHTGGNLTIAYCDSTPNTGYSMTLSLPAGVWTVYVVGNYQANDTSRINAIAIREG